MPSDSLHAKRWSRPEARAALEHLAYMLDRTPSQADLARYPGEAPSRMWWYRNWPGGWKGALKDVLGSEPRQVKPPAGRPNFCDPVIQAKAQAARSGDGLPDAWYGWPEDRRERLARRLAAIPG